MAIVTNQNSQQQITLRSQHIFGRHPATAHTLLSDQSTSGIHATLIWNGSFWLIKDSSTNGTFVNNERLESGQKEKLTINDTVQFGNHLAEQWKVTDLSSPKSMLFCIGQHDKIIELEGLTVFPNVDSPEISIYQKSQTEWILESQHEQRVLNSGEQVGLGDEQWVFISPEDIDETIPTQINPDNPPSLNFAVSNDEEHVDLSIEWNQQKIKLGERVHHYLLLCLARKRISDQNDGINKQEQGWLEKDLLVIMTGMDEKHINIQIYRFRKQLLESESLNNKDLLSIIQRRRGQLRLDCNRIKIDGGHSL